MRAESWHQTLYRLPDFDCSLSSLLSGQQRKADLQYAVQVFGWNGSPINGFIHRKSSDKSAAAVLTHHPVGPLKAFRRRVGNNKLIAFEFQVEMFFDSTRSENQHFKAGFGFVHINRRSLVWPDEQVSVVPASAIAFCGELFIMIHTWDFK